MNKDLYDPDDLIAALATPWAASAMAVIRVSGDGSIDKMAPLFKGAKQLTELKPRSMSFGRIIDPKNEEVLDEVMVAPFKAPRSYTGQESVEVFCHGSLPGIQKILDLLFRSGFRQASPGEFTFRAFTNGKMDLTQAEAVQEIVSAKSGKAQSLALTRLSGGLFDRIDAIKELFLTVAATFAIQLDYPEDEVEAPDMPLEMLNKAKSGLKELIASYNVGKVYKDGVVVALAGPTNAGKSSLFNLFLKEDRSIVSDVHGTTRDFLESWVSLDGIPVRLYDTAGLRDSDDPIEAEGIRRTRGLIDSAQILLYVVDGSQGLSPEDQDVLSQPDPRRLLIWNKADKESQELPEGGIAISAATGQGFHELEQELKSRVFDGNLDVNSDAVVDSLRQKELLERALLGVDKVLEDIDNDLPVDILAMELHDAMEALGEITGEVSSFDILEKMFSGFCVGK